MLTAHGVVDGLVLLRKRLRSGDVVDVITINTHLVRHGLEILQQLGIDLEPSLKHCLGCLGRKRKTRFKKSLEILLMEEIVHQLIGSFSHYL